MTKQSPTRLRQYSWFAEGAVQAALDGVRERLRENFKALSDEDFEKVYRTAVQRAARSATKFK